MKHNKYYIHRPRFGRWHTILELRADAWTRPQAEALAEYFHTRYELSRFKVSTRPTHAWKNTEHHESSGGFKYDLSVYAQIVADFLTWHHMSPTRPQPAPFTRTTDKQMKPHPNSLRSQKRVMIQTVSALPHETSLYQVACAIRDNGATTLLTIRAIKYYQRIPEHMKENNAHVFIHAVHPALMRPCFVKNGQPTTNPHNKCAYPEYTEQAMTPRCATPFYAIIDKLPSEVYNRSRLKIPNPAEFIRLSTEYPGKFSVYITILDASRNKLTAVKPARVMELWALRGLQPPAELIKYELEFRYTRQDIEEGYRLYSPPDNCMRHHANAFGLPVHPSHAYASYNELSGKVPEEWERYLTCLIMIRCANTGRYLGRTIACPNSKTHIRLYCDGNREAAYNALKEAGYTQDERTPLILVALPVNRNEIIQPYPDNGLAYRLATHEHAPPVLVPYDLATNPEYQYNSAHFAGHGYMKSRLDMAHELPSIGHAYDPDDEDDDEDNRPLCGCCEEPTDVDDLTYIDDINRDYCTSCRDEYAVYLEDENIFVTSDMARYDEIDGTYYRDDEDTIAVYYTPHTTLAPEHAYKFWFDIAPSRLIEHALNGDVLLRQIEDDGGNPEIHAYGILRQDKDETPLAHKLETLAAICELDNTPFIAPVWLQDAAEHKQQETTNNV